MSRCSSWYTIYGGVPSVLPHINSDVHAFVLQILSAYLGMTLFMGHNKVCFIVIPHMEGRNAY